MANNLFYSDIGSDKYKDIYQRVMNLDRGVTSYDDRLKIVNSILHDNSFIINYFSDYYDPILNKDSKLSSDNNICGLVEVLANYLLMSDESLEMNKQEKTHYINSSSLKKKKEFSLGDSIKYVDDSQIEFVAFNQQNYKLDKKQKITLLDLQRSDYLGDVLRDYECLLRTIDHKLHSPADGRRRIYTAAKHSVKDDQIIAKDSILGVWGYNINPPQSRGNSSYMSFNDDATVKELLQSRPNPHNYDLWILSLDFERLMDRLSLSNEQSEILSLFRAGFTEKKIAKRLMIPQQTVSFKLKKIINLIETVNHQTTTEFIRNRYNKETI